ncbi:hypothetical protein AAY473_031011 [Plecturocebus cupreus]
MKTFSGKAQRLTLVIPALWEAKAGRSHQASSLRPACPIWFSPSRTSISMETEKANVVADITKHSQNLLVALKRSKKPMLSTHWVPTFPAKSVFSVRFIIRTAHGQTQPGGFTEAKELIRNKLECDGTTSARCNLCLPGSSNSPALPSQVPGITGVEMGFLHVGQAGLKLLTSGDLPTATSQSAVAHACNSSTLGVRGGQTTRSRDQDHAGRHGETLSLLKIQKLARHGEIKTKTFYEKEINGPGAMAHTYNPSMLGGGGKRISLRPAWATWWNPISTKNTKTSRHVEMGFHHVGQDGLDLLTS